MSFPRYERYKDSGPTWFGRVPSHWAVLDGRRVFTQKRDASLPDDPQLSATQKYGVIPQTLFMELEQQKVVLALKGTDAFKHVEIDDFIISLRSFQGGIEKSHYRGCVSTAYTVLRSTKNIDAKYWEYLLKSSPYIDALSSVTDGIREGRSISYAQFGGLPLPFPSVCEQTAIAAFLDYETAKIDALIEEQRRLIELLKEKRQAVISHTVTKGLDTDVTMRDSGLPGLGTVPSHWEVLRLKEVCQRDDGIQMGPFGGMLLGLDSEDTGFKVYGQQNTIWGDFSLGDRWISPKRYESLERYRLQVGDLVLTRKGSLGNARLVKTEIMPGIIDSDTIRIRLEALRASSSFVTLLFHEAFYVEWEIDMMKRGAILPGVNSRTIANLFIALPPRPEQDEIMEYLATRLGDLDQLIENVNASTLILLERRSALISAAVTGKIDVRNYTPKEAA